MSLKLKVLMLAVLPLLLVTAAITYVSSKQAHRLSEDEIKLFEQHLVALKKRELQHFVELAYTSIKHLENDLAINEQQAKSEIKTILNSLTFGEDGYFFCL